MARLRSYATLSVPSRLFLRGNEQEAMKPLAEAGWRRERGPAKGGGEGGGGVQSPEKII